MDRQNTDRTQARLAVARQTAVDQVTRMTPVARPKSVGARNSALTDRMPNGDPNSLTLWGTDGFDG